MLETSIAGSLPIDAVYKPLRAGFLDRFVRAQRSRFGGNPIPHKRFFREVLRRRHSARIYALVADQTPLEQDNKHWVRFLGQDTAFFVGADRIARALDAPVFFVAMRREGRGRYAARLEVLAEPPYESGPQSLSAAAIVDRYAGALEREIRRSPADWLWIHRKWKYRRAQAS